MQIQPALVIVMFVACSEATAADPAPHVQRVRLTLGEEGECRLVVDARNTGVVPAQPKGDATKVAGLRSASVHRTAAGTLRAVHSFSEVKSTSDFSFLNGVMPLNPQGLAIDKTAGTLILSPVPMKDSKGRRATLFYPRTLAPPIDVAIELKGHAKGLLAFGLNMQSGTLDVQVLPVPGGKSRLTVTWFPVAEGKRGEQQVLLEQAFEAGKVSEYSFRPPFGAGEVQERASLVVAAAGQDPVAVRRIEVEARMVPFFGASLETDAEQGEVKVAKCIKGSPAEKAGVKAGDVLVSLDGERMPSYQKALTRLGRVAIGDPVKFAIRRDGKEQVIAVKAE